MLYLSGNGFKPLGIAIVGAGYWGPNVLRNLITSPQWGVRLLCDLDPVRLARAARPYPGLGTTQHYEEVLADRQVTAVVIATPAETHYTLARAALEAGKHVLIEKPLTSNSADGEALCDLAERLGLTVMVDHTFLFTSPVEYLKRYIADGRMGDVFYIDTVRVNLGLFQAVANVILDLAPHDVSIINHLLGTTPLEVATTVAHCINPQIADVAYLTMRYPNNVLAHAHLSWLSPVKMRRMNIAGRSKMVVWDDVEADRIKIYDKGVEVEPDPMARLKNLVTYRTGDMVAPALDNMEALGKVVDEFYHVIVDGIPSRSTGRDGLEVVRILEAADRSIQNDGHFVPVSTVHA